MAHRRIHTGNLLEAFIQCDPQGASEDTNFLDCALEGKINNGEVELDSAFDWSWDCNSDTCASFLPSSPVFQDDWSSLFQDEWSLLQQADEFGATEPPPTFHGDRSPLVDCLEREQATTTFKPVRSPLKTKTNQHPCTLCGKVFHVQTNLKAHLLTHTNEKPFACQTCGKSFNHPTSLRHHLATHASKRPFPCRLCNRDFTTKGNLQRHTMRLHKESL